MSYTYTIGVKERYDDGHIDNWNHDWAGDSYHLKMGEDAGDHIFYSIFRFQMPVTLTSADQVTEATLTFESAGETNTQASDALRIWIEDDNDSAQVTQGTEAPYASSPRTLRASYVRWPESGGLTWPASGTTITTPDISSLIKDIITNVGSINAGSHITFWIGADTLREALWHFEVWDFGESYNRNHQTVRLNLTSTVDPTPAFPGAEGYGYAAVGGRFAEIRRVTNLNDSGAGSLRNAINSDGESDVPATIVFDVSGEITLSSDLNIRMPYITIAGETAPSPGITIRGYGLRIYHHDIIIRHLRFRTGDENGTSNRDGLTIESDDGNSYNIIIDHCSFAWGVDSNLDVTYNDSFNITVSNCIHGETLKRADEARGLSMLVNDDLEKISHLKNWSHSNVGRHPITKGGTYNEVYNNYIYNNETETFYVVPDDGSRANKGYFVGNVAETGPTSSLGADDLFGVRFKSGLNVSSEFYVVDNVGPSGNYTSDTPGIFVGADPLPAGTNRAVISSATVKGYVLSNAGARPLDRDDVDQRFYDEVISGGGATITSQSALTTAWPTLDSNTSEFTDPASATSVVFNGYTNRELALHAAARGVSQNPSGKGNNMKIFTSIYFLNDAE